MLGITTIFTDGSTHQTTKSNSNHQCNTCGSVSYLVDGFCSHNCATIEEESSHLITHYFNEERES